MIRRRVMVVIALSVMIFTATTSVLVGLKEAPAAFAASEGYVITSLDASTIFSSRVDMEMASALEAIDNITGVSPEVFAFSSWNGRSFVVRGVDFSRLGSVGPELVTEMAVEPSGDMLGYALLGERLADRLALQPPATIPLAGSYSSSLEVVLVAGTFASGSSFDDEMLVPVDVARRLAGMGDGEASVIRVSAEDPAWLESILSPDSARFTIYNLSVSRSQLGPGEECNITVSVMNWGGSAGSAEVIFADGGVAFAEETVTLNGSSSISLCVRFGSSVSGVHDITVSVSGDFPIVLSSSVEVVEPYLVASFPKTVMLGSYLGVRLMTYVGEPVPGVSVVLSDTVPSANTTDPSGSCALYADEAGSYPVLFDPSGTEFEGMVIRGSGAEVEVVDLSSLPTAFLPSVTALGISPDYIKEGEAADALVTVENAGSLSGAATVELIVDSEVFCVLEVSLGPAQGKVVSCELTGLAPGEHTVQAEDFSASIEVAPWYADNPGLVELVIRYGGSSTLSSAASLPIYQAAKISEGNISLTLFALGAIAAMLVTLAIVSVYSKEIHDGRKRLGILRALGASKQYIRKLVFPQALGAALAGSLAGIIVGLAATSYLVDSGAFVIFGHVLEFGASAQLVLLILAGAVAISVVSALLSAEFAVRETAMSSMRELPEEDNNQKDASELLGEG